MNKKAKTVVGVDFGSSVIKIVQLKQAHPLPQLVTFGLAEKIPGTQSSKSSTGRAQTAGVLTELLLQSRSYATQAVAALPATSVFNAIVELPNMPKKDIGSAIQWEIKKTLPIPPEQMSLHWHLIEPANQKTAGQSGALQVIINATPKNIAGNYMEIIKQSGLKLAALETEIKALQRSVLPADNGNYLVLDIGATNTNLIAFTDCLPLINRNLDLGMELISTNLVQKLGITREQADQAREASGLPLVQTDIKPDQDIIQSLIDVRLIRELQHLLRELNQRYKKSVQKIFIIGGGARLKNITEYIALKSGLNASRPNPWEKISCPGELAPQLLANGPQMAVCIGLALQVMES